MHILPQREWVQPDLCYDPLYAIAVIHAQLAGTVSGFGGHDFQLCHHLNLTQHSCYLEQKVKCTASAMVMCCHLSYHCAMTHYIAACMPHLDLALG